MSASAQEIEFFTPSIVRVVKTPDGTVPDRKSLVVTAKPDKVAVSIADKGHVRTYKTKQLTIASRQGSFPGMLKARTFVLQLPDGTSKTVTYTGKAIRTRL